MLAFKNVSVSVGHREVVRDLSLTVAPGELHVLMGPNGSGKSSLLAAAMGLDGYQVTHGDVLFNGQSVLELSTDERAKRGMGLAFQRPPALEGVTYAAFVSAIGAEDVLEQEAERLDLAQFAHRDLNVGFSGGEPSVQRCSNSSCKRLA